MRKRLFIWSLCCFVDYEDRHRKSSALIFNSSGICNGTTIAEDLSFFTNSKNSSTALKSGNQSDFLLTSKIHIPNGVTKTRRFTEDIQRSPSFESSNLIHFNRRQSGKNIENWA